MGDKVILGTFSYHRRAHFLIARECRAVGPFDIRIYMSFALILK